ncbi:UNVERIFIED_CONTAM: hypothetical protein PYX00_002527 [Menopon gallinae]|uniref:Protoporphyrinogen oxidase n=1 Tax=Menopon gallinae TaxID=328185 RepID=A0AAW2IHE2_9NEOP
MSKVILGGGISGLSAAYYLSKKPSNGIVLYEASERLGGWIRTRESTSGAFFEQGARTLRWSSATADATYEMIHDIGLSSSLKPAWKAVRDRYFYIDNELRKMPNSWTALFRKSTLFDEPLLFPVLRDIFGVRKTVHDESVYDFILRRFGRKYADVLSAVICGVYAGNAGEISIKSFMRPVFEKEQKYGSVCLGMLLDQFATNKNTDRKPKTNRKLSGVWFFDKGMESLPLALADYLKTKETIEIHLNKFCRRIDFKDGKVLLDIDGDTVFAEHLYSSLPSNHLSNLLSNEHTFLKEELSKIPFVSIAVVNLEYEGEVLPMQAFGLLVPPNQNMPILGVIFDSCIYPQGDKTVLTVMIGGRWFKKYLGPKPDRDFILKMATDHVERILNVQTKPINHVVSILQDCIPQYIVGHNDTVERIKSYISQKKLPLTLIGNSYTGVGIPDSILSAKMGVELQSRI